MEPHVKGNKAVNSASLIDLKAELYRKQEEFKKQKLQSNQLGQGYIKGKTSTSTKKPSLFTKSNTGVSKRAEKDYEEKKEEENVFEKSRQILEKKARLYEKISSGVELPEEDGSGVFLVDFQKKVIDDRDERRERERREQERKEREQREEEEERRLQALPIPDPESEDDQWVDYVDAFGRSRRCLKKDLPTLKQQDQKLQGKTGGEADLGTQSLLSKDMAREIDRQKWEQQELETMEEEKKGPIHYSDVRYNEVRTHGVGFYQFDKDEESRQAQMEQLHKLRQQTKDERSKSERVKEKRKAALAARLAKVKQRKRAKLGLTGDDEDEAAKSSGEEEEIGPKPSNQSNTEPEPLTRDDSWRTTTPSSREWDRGKQVSMEASERAWLEKQRSERENEFAPPSFYYDNSSTASTGSAKSKTFDKTGQTLHSEKSSSASSERKAEFAPPAFFSSSSTVKLSESETSASNTENNTRNTTNITGSSHSDDSKRTCNLRDAIEKQLHSIRESHDVCVTMTNSDNSVKTEPEDASNETDLPQTLCTGDSTQMADMIPPVPFAQAQIPAPNCMMQPVNFHMPPPNLAIPPPNMQMPAPNIQVPPPNMQVPQLNIHAPPPNNQFPPQNMQVPPFNIQVPPTNMQVPATNINLPPPNFYPNPASTEQSIGLMQSCASNQSSAMPNVPARKVIPKESILDTRLMERSPGNKGSADTDKQLQLLQQNIQTQMVMKLVQDVSNKCFEKCVYKPGASLDNYQKKCLAHCMDRYLESQELMEKFYMKRLLQESGN